MMTMDINQFSKKFLINFGNLTVHHDSYRGDSKDYSIFSPDLAIANLPYAKEEYKYCKFFFMPCRSWLLRTFNLFSKS